MSRSNGNLVAFLEEDVLPRLFERLDVAFPEFGWERTQDGWVASQRETTKRLLGARAERVICNRPFGFYAHGGESMSWLAYLNGGRTPRGEGFLVALRRACELAGVPFPDREISPAEARALHEAESRRQALDAVLRITQAAWSSEAAAPARSYMAQRGLGGEDVRALGLGFYPTPAEVRQALDAELHHAALDAGLLRDQLTGYVVFPWHDDWGRLLTLYFRWQAKQASDERPKTLALPGVGTKRSPLYFDRARAAGERDLVLVEGVLDGAVLQARGDRRVVACVGAQLSRGQVATLVRHKVGSVTICLDPDGAGEKGTRSCVRSLEEAGISAFVAPTLPNELDPDEMVLRDGVEGWRAHVAKAVSGARYHADRALEGVTPESPDPVRSRAVREVGEVVASLRGPSGARERDELARLLAKATGYRVGALKAELPQPGAAVNDTPKPAEKREARVTVWPYREDPSGLVWVKERFNQHGQPEFEDVQLTNFSARIAAEVIEDDGAEERRCFEIRGKVGPRTSSFRIPSSRYTKLDWVVEQLGANAVIEPGAAMRDRTRHAIQVLSGEPERRRVYKHLGWRQIDERWVFLHAEGALGEGGPVEDVEVLPEEPLDRFALPVPPEGKELREAVAASLRLLEVAPRRLTVPLLAAPWRAVLDEVDLSLFLYGGSGYHKTCLAALAQQHFGPALHYQNLPGSWESSANALEGALFLAKNALFVVDDFIPTGSVHDRARRYRDLDRIVRGQGNRAGRARMRPDATLRPVKRSRALVLCTGEEVPRGESLTARMLILPVGPGDVHQGQLTRCQADADRGLYAQAMSGFLSWLAPRYEQVRRGLRAELGKLRGEFTCAGAHRRLADLAANLFLGLRALARFLEAIGLYSAAAAEAFLETGRGALLDAMRHQVESQEDTDPTRRFFDLLSSALASGRAHVAGANGKVPFEHEQAWGWRIAAEGKPERESLKPGGGEEEPYWEAQGERIGWVDGDDLYLEPQACHTLVQRVSGEEGFALSPRSLRRRLKESGILRTQSGSRDTCSVRVTLAGARRSVLHLDTSAILGERVREELFADVR